MLVACGSAHTAVTTDNGHTYTWGWGVNGQLGHGDDATLNVPTVVKKLENVYASAIACGLAHTVSSPLVPHFWSPSPWNHARVAHRLHTWIIAEVRGVHHVGRCCVLRWQLTSSLISA